MNRTAKRGGGVSMTGSNAMESEMIPEFCCTTPYYEMLTVKSGTAIFSLYVLLSTW